MYKIPLFIVVLMWMTCFAGTLAHGQQMRWMADKQLTWDDFKGKKPNKSKWDAVTNCYLRYTLNYSTEDSADVLVTNVFNSDLSWKRYKKLRPYLLQHEQTHFDIAELYARKIRRSFGEYKLRKNPKYHTEALLKIEYKEQISAMRCCQRKYDRQTRHSRKKKMQLYWNKKVADELYELKDFELKEL